MVVAVSLRTPDRSGCFPCFFEESSGTQDNTAIALFILWLIVWLLRAAVYNTYTLENVGNLRGHNGKVKSISWNLDDTKLISAGMDGAVYEWRLKDCKREKENVMKGCLYNCCAGSADGRLLFAAGSDRCVPCVHLVLRCRIKRSLAWHLLPLR